MLLAISAFFEGLFLFQLLIYAASECKKQGCVALMLSLAFLIAPIVIYFGDFVHFMNRDITDWVYASEGFVGFLSLSAWVMLLAGRN